MRAAIEDFILHLATERGLSTNYQLSTRLSLEGFALWLERRKLTAAMGERALDDLIESGGEPPNVDTPLAEITLQDIGAYLAHKKRLGLSAASIKLVVVAIKIFFRWLHARKRIPHDVAENLPLPRTERYLPETMNELQTDQLLEGIPVNAPRGLRDRAILELLYASGLRVSELVNARLEYFDMKTASSAWSGRGAKRGSSPSGKRRATPSARIWKRSAPAW